jgi:asparagine synthase (glutamine-hydrolysing)
MLKATIALSDLAYPPRWADGAVVFGGSRIAPFDHPALETLLVRTDGQWFAAVRERRSEADAQTIRLDVDAAEFERRYRECLLWPLDYVMLEAAQAGCRLKLRAGAFGSLPVYARSGDDRLDLSWDAADLMQSPTALDVEIASHRLALHTIYSARQLGVGVLMLTERASLSVEPGKASYHYPPPAQETQPAPPRERAAWLAEFAAHLNQAVNARPFMADRSALELSGGMDSATVACGLAPISVPRTSLGILLEGDTRQPQLHRRRAIVERLALRDHTVEIAAFPPSLDLRPAPGARPGFHQEYYLEACAALWDQARALGCDRFYTGIGGDELFPDYAHELADHGEALEVQRERTQRADVEQLLTPRAREAARSLHCFGAPASPVPATALVAQGCRAPDIARRGLWPINPLSDPRLAQFCHRLPAEQRRERALMQRHLQERLGEDTFPAGYRKETFEQVFPALIATQAQDLAGQLRECALADLGLVDPRGAMSLLDAVATRRARAPTAVLVSFLWLERFARQAA